MPASYHLLTARPDATVLLQMGDVPLLVVGHYGKGRTIAYTGFSPEGSAKVGEHSTILDRALRESADNRLFALISAAVLELVSGEDPSAPLQELVESRTTPLYETLKNAPRGPWPEVTLSWTRDGDGSSRARIHMKNGPAYFRGFRLRFEGPDFHSGRALALWTNQYFDLLPGEEVECEVEVITEDRRALREFSLEGEAIHDTDSRTYPIPAPPS